jgi:lactoylglutathione lyase
MAKAKAKPAKKPAATKAAAKKPVKAATPMKAAKPVKAAVKPAKTTKRARTEPPATAAAVGPYLRSLRTCIYQVHDLALAKEFYSQALGKDPYFDEPFYVGFDVDGHELGLDPDISKRPPGGSGVIGYWRVEDINAAWQHLTTIGATSIELPHAVGVDLQVSIVADPFGNYIGLIQGA